MGVMVKGKKGWKGWYLVYWVNETYEGGHGRV
jgi:hypothetical protein